MQISGLPKWTGPGRSGHVFQVNWPGRAVTGLSSLNQPTASTEARDLGFWVNLPSTSLHMLKNLEQSERLKESWSTYHLERSERLEESGSTYHRDRSKRLKSLDQAVTARGFKILIGGFYTGFLTDNLLPIT